MVKWLLNVLEKGEGPYRSSTCISPPEADRAASSNDLPSSTLLADPVLLLDADRKTSIPDLDDVIILPPGFQHDVIFMHPDFEDDIVALPPGLWYDIVVQPADTCEEII